MRFEAARAAFTVTLLLAACTPLSQAAAGGAEQHNWVLADKAVYYSALWDPFREEVNIFVDLPEEVGSKVHNCVFGKGSVEHNEYALAIMLRDHPSAYMPYRIRCGEPAFDPEWVILALTDGTRLSTRLAVETVNTRRLGTSGACLGPVHQPRTTTIHDWLRHSLAMGITYFQVYVTQEGKQMETLDITQGIADTDGRPFDIRAQAPLTWDRDEPPQAAKPAELELSQPVLVWHRFDSPPKQERYEHGQSSVYHDCLFRLRHSFDYLVLLNDDEFIFLNETTPGHPHNLTTFLDHFLAPGVASVRLSRWNYPVHCAQGDLSEVTQGGAIHQKFTLREKTCRGFDDRSKMVVRPVHVSALSPHSVYGVDDGTIHETVIPCHLAFVKHFEFTPGEDPRDIAACEELVNEVERKELACDDCSEDSWLVGRRRRRALLSAAP